MSDVCVKKIKEGNFETLEYECQLQQRGPVTFTGYTTAVIVALWECVHAVDMCKFADERVLVLLTVIHT